MTNFFKKIFRPFNHLKIVNKMMLIYAVGGLFPLIILSFYLIGETRTILINQATHEAVNNATRIEERINDIFNIATDVSDALYLDEQLRRIILSDYKDELSVVNTLKNYTKMDDYLRLYPAIDSIRFYNKNLKLLDNSQIIKAKDVHVNSEWYQRAIEENGKIAFVYRYDDISHSSYISLVRLIKNNYSQNVGVLVINMSNREWRKLVASEPYEIIGVIDDSEIFISLNRDYEGLNIHLESKLSIFYMLDEEINDYSDGLKRFKIIKNDFETHNNGNHIRLLTIIPTEIFVDFANQSIQNSLILISLSIIVALTLVYLLTRIFSDKLLVFRKNLHRVTLGDFNLDYHYQGEDEIGALFIDLQIMTESIKAHIQKEYESGVQKEHLTVKQREVEFKMLTSQIDPHFLYNTLETIRMEALVSKQHDIAHIVKKLASIMRRKLSVTDSEVSLESELELIVDYLDIQKFRFRERISFEIEKKCDITNFKILPLLIQPIVENAFIHGLEGKTGLGFIHIIIDEDVNQIIISIIDNGVGIPEGDLEKIREKMSVTQYTASESIGLTNVIQRIRIFYGDPFRVSIESNPDIGTTVKLFLPRSL